MRRVIVGTAGHIDHGKTSLVKALTGIDCDRWEQEKTRGITIDLGFAHLEEGDLQVGFVDVPGHQRFLHNALAGLGGIRVLLLVVAADEGVKPQTREHLDICSLLEIPTAVVALTKADLAGPDLVELAQLEIEELLATGPFADAPVIPVSSVTGDGLDALKKELLSRASAYALEERDPEGQAPEEDLAAEPARLPVDRAFHLKGVGVVVTGTLAAGAIAAGDSLEIDGTGTSVRVRSVQVHGASRPRALAGERTSLQLSGIELDQLRRGLQLTAPDSFVRTRELACRVRLLADAPKTITGFVPVRLHLFASEIVGKMRPLGGLPLEPGGTGLVEIRLSQAVLAARGDRVILRRPSPALTLGGGIVLDPAWRRHRGKALEAARDVLGGELPPLLALWVLEAGEAGATAEDLAHRLGRNTAEARMILEELTAGGRLLEVPKPPGGRRRWLAPAVLKRVVERAGRLLKEYFRRNRLARGMPKAEAVQRILRGRAQGLTTVYLHWLEAQGALVVDGDLVLQPGRKAQLTGEESKLAMAVQAAYEEAGLTPASPQEISRNLGAKPQILEGVVGYLVARHRLTKLPNGLILASAALSELETQLRATGWVRFDVARFKDRFGLSRKWAIPLLEHLDSVETTRRLGDERMIVPKNP